jgi:hypothetical protein
MTERKAVTITKLVEDRKGHARWAVIGSFVGLGGSEPRCVDYRVRVIPEASSKRMAAGLGRQVSIMLAEQTDLDHSLFRAGEASAPAEGIPRRVFEEASQTRLLEMARKQVRQGRVQPEVASLIERQGKPRRGRPPARSLGEKLQILKAVEDAFTSGRTLEDVAREHHMSRGSVRNLLAWARSDADPQLFDGTTPGRRGGRLTPAARALLNKRVE